MRDSLLNNKSIDFSLRIIELCKYLKTMQREYTISNQIIRSGTSIGANIHEAFFAQSTKDFINKMQIALKEESETNYWLILLGRSGYIPENLYLSLKADCDELGRLLNSTITTAKRNLDKADTVIF